MHVIVDFLFLSLLVTFIFPSEPIFRSRFEIRQDSQKRGGCPLHINITPLCGTIEFR